jgi:hypothetical protein
MPGTHLFPVQRRFDRAELRGRAVLFFGKDSEVSETVQISEAGLMTYTSLRLAVGDQLTVHFSVTEKYLRARAEVVYLLPEDNEGRLKVGLRFKSLFEEYRSAIREYLS